MNLNKKAFTLIEVIVSVLISSIVIIVGFQAYTMILAGKIKLIERTRLQKEAVFFTERLFQTIKSGGTIDYEEYFNRKLIGTGLTLSGHYKKNSGFGNFGKGGNPGKSGTTNYGSGFYYCRSGDGVEMTSTGGCFDDENLNSGGIKYSGEPQRYGQYSFQFIDYNIDHNDDNGDTNGDNSIIGDDDDENLGNGPEVFKNGVNVHELYLISGNKKFRTFFRYNRKLDSNAPTNKKCSNEGTGGCIGTIEYLVLKGDDQGINHNDTGKYKNDGIIDTWLIDDKFSSKKNEVAGSENTDSYRKPLFPKNINVSSFEIYPYPNKEQARAWGVSGDEAKYIRISPYIILSILIEPSWKIKRKIRGDIPSFRFNTTVNLTDVFSK